MSTEGEGSRLENSPFGFGQHDISVGLWRDNATIMDHGKLVVVPLDVDDQVWYSLQNNLCLFSDPFF